PEHLTTAFFYPTPAGLVPNPYTPDTVGQVNANVLVTGQLPTAAEMTQPFREPGGDQYLHGHLLNFFRENSGTPAAPNPGYYRLFEYVEVPSRINGSQDPSVPQIPGDTAGRGRADRVPGKININTIYEQEVFQAALNNHPLALDATAAGWVNSQIPAYPGGL